MNTYSYSAEQLTSVFAEIIQQQPDPGARNQLQEREALSSVAGFNKAFVLMPRTTGKAPVVVSERQGAAIAQIRPGFSITDYSIDRLCRVWLLLQLDSTNEEKYFETIDGLFLAADVNELVALYGALPVLAWPQKWIARCAEGIRSNIGGVLETVICDNPYPSEYLGEAAWNQLVLKAFFTEKDTDRIIGLEERANRSLADTLCDFAHERWAASRRVPLQLWRCVAPFIDAGNFSNIQKAVSSEEPDEQKAGLLACYHSSYPPAKALLDQYPAIQSDIQAGKLSWHSLAKENFPVV